MKRLFVLGIMLVLLAALMVGSVSAAVPPRYMPGGNPCPACWTDSVPADRGVDLSLLLVSTAR
jgi:hypothetical protein